VVFHGLFGTNGTIYLLTIHNGMLRKHVKSLGHLVKLWQDRVETDFKEFGRGPGRGLLGCL
jgi:hypothetical protein